MQLTGYEAVEVVATGWRSTTYRAVRADDASRVLLRCPDRTANSGDTWPAYRYAQTLGQAIGHPTIARVAGLESAGGHPVLVLDHAPGWALVKQFPVGSVADLNTALTIGLQVASGLAALHEEGLTQHDLSPSNLLYDPQSGRTTLAAYGMTGRAFALLDAVRRRPELLPFLAPETGGWSRRPLDARVDLFSLGATLYWLLSGRAPTAEGSASNLQAHASMTPRPLHALVPNLPVVVSDLVTSLIERSPEHRPHSAATVAADLESALWKLEHIGTIEPFELGRRGRPQGLHVPHRLFGRRSQADQLLSTLEAVAEGAARIVLIAGPAGVGKSTLARELHGPTLRYGGTFAEGKFDQLSGHPYSAYLQAIGSIANSLLTHDDPERTAEIRTILGTVGALLTGAVPSLATLLGDQPPVGRVGPSELRNRFHQLCLRFFRVFARPAAPLVLFLDDLQWAEEGPVALLQSLLDDPEAANLLVVCAYRPVETLGAHPLPAAITALEESHTHVVRVPLGPLSSAAVTDLVGEVLGTSAARAQPLAGAVFEATSGNPLGIHRYLRLLVESGKLRVGSDQSEWTWDLETAASEPAAASDLLNRRLKLLPLDTQKTLAVAACFGGRFDAREVASVMSETRSAVMTQLLPAVRGDLVYPCMGSGGGTDVEAHCFVFAHDEVQTAAYGLVPQERREVLHGQIGHHIFDSSRRDPNDMDLHRVARQLERGTLAELRADDRRALALLCDQASEVALRTGAYETAATYARGALGLVGSNAWESDHEVTAKLFLSAAVAEWLSKDVDAARRRLAEALEHATSQSDRMDVLVTHAQLAGLTGRFEEALNAGFDGLANLGIEVPQTEPEWTAATEALGATLMGALDGRDPVILLSGAHDAALESPRVRDALRVISSLSSPAYTRPELFPWLVMQSVLLTAEHGPSPDSLIGFVWYGLLLCAGGQYDAGRAFATAALAEAERGPRSQLPQLLHPHAVFVQHWTEPYEAAASNLDEAILLGHEHGNHTSAAWAAMTLPWTLFVAGSPLHTVAAKSASNMSTNLSVFRNQDAGLMNAWTLNQAYRLVGDEKALRHLAKRGLSETDITPRIEHFVGYVAANHTAALMTCCFLEEWEQALEHAEAAREMAAAMGGSVWVTELEFFHALALLSAPQPPPDLGDRLTVSLELLERWASSSQANHGWKHELIGAELAALTAEDEAAEAGFERAIQSAERHERTHGRALACLRAARFREARGRPNAALGMTVRALDALHTWGAHEAVARLIKTNPLLQRTFGGETSAPIQTEPVTTSPPGSTSRLIDAIEPGVCETDELGRITFANAAVSRLTGWLPHELTAQPLTRLLDVPNWEPRDLAAVPVVQREVDLLTRRGIRLPVEASIRPLRTDTGDIPGAVVSFTDISGRRTLEQQLRHAQKMRAMGEFAGGVAHDFNNLLTPVIGYISLARGMLGPRHRAEAPLADAEHAAERATELVKQMLAFGRRADIFMEPTPLSPLLHEMEKFAGRALDRSIQIQLSVPADLDWVAGDAGLLHQVLMNLILNARDACAEVHDRPPQIGLSATNVRLDQLPPAAPSSSRPGRFVCIEVTDSGTGMDRETVQRVFEPFFTTKPAGQGVGLGLAVVFGIMQRHDGWIECESEPGEGTTFRCWLPGRDPVAATPAREVTPGPLPTVSSARLLVVDDEPLLRKLATAVFEAEGHTVATAANGREAVTRYVDDEHGFDLVLLDLSMPVLSGEEALAEILAHDPEAKVVLWSGYARQGGEASAQDLGAKAFVAKPVKPDALAQVVQTVLDSD